MVNKVKLIIGNNECNISNSKRKLPNKSKWKNFLHFHIFEMEEFAEYKKCFTNFPFQGLWGEGGYE